MNNQLQNISEEDHTARHARRAEIRRQKLRMRRRETTQRLLPWTLAVVLLVFACVRLTHGTKTLPGSAADGSASVSEMDTLMQSAPNKTAQVADTVEETAETVHLTEEIESDYAVLIDLGTNRILAEKNAAAAISPASMTKILTVLVAAEQVTNLDDTFTVPAEILDDCYQNDCSAVGFLAGETITVRDLFYGTVLPSGADAALSLATYVAGSQDAFVKLMNEKATELGLSDSAHFTNCIGLYDAAHTCTVSDMALILKAAEENALCRQVLSTHTYTTSATEAHPDGISISNWFLRRIEDKDTGDLTVQCAKTGYVCQSGSCAASYATDGQGRGYLCVTGMASSSWRCIYDHAALYKQFAGQQTSK